MLSFSINGCHLRVAGPNSSIVLVVAAEPHARQSGDAEGLPLLLPQVSAQAASDETTILLTMSSHTTGAVVSVCQLHPAFVVHVTTRTWPLVTGAGDVGKCRRQVPAG